MKMLILLIAMTSLVAHADTTNQYCYAASIMLKASPDDVNTFKQKTLNDIAKTGKHNEKDPLEMVGFFLGMQISILQSDIKYGYSSIEVIRHDYNEKCNREL